MVQAIVDEAKQILREIPGFAVAVVLTVAMCAGIRAAIFYQADGEDLRLIADGSNAKALGKSDLMERTRVRLECAENIPGVTVVVAWSHYNVELSVPMKSMRLMFERSRPDVARTIAEKASPRAA